MKSDGDGDSHLQGLAGYKDHFLLTHSDADKPSGQHPGAWTRRPESNEDWSSRVPAARHFDTSGPALFHAGRLPD